MRQKLKLYLLLVIFTVFTSVLFILSVTATETDTHTYDISADNDGTVLATLTKIGEDEYSLLISGDGMIYFEEAPYLDFAQRITALTVDSDVSLLPPEVFRDLVAIQSLVIKNYRISLPTELTEIPPFTKIYIHENSTATQLFSAYTDRINYICEFAEGTCVECGFECFPHYGGVSTCLSGALCSKCGFEYEEPLTTHTGGTATCKDRAVCDVCHNEYGELLTTHTGGTATCKERAVCDVCDTEYGALLETHSGGVATCTDRAVCTVCDTPYGEVGEHARTYFAAVLPSCESYGTVERYHCSICNLNFDENGNEILNIYLGATWHSGGEATCTAPAVCDVCGSEYGDVDAENHSYTKAYDAQTHYEECLCGDKINTVAHTLTSEIIKEATESETGTRKYSCECGYSKTEEIPMLVPDNEDNQNQNTDTNPDEPPRKEKEDYVVLKILFGISLPLVSISVVFTVVAFMRRRKIKS